MTELILPHIAHTESFNQDKVSMGTTAVLHFAKQLPDLTNMLSIAFMGMAQGVDLRGKENYSVFLQKNYKTIRTKIKKHINGRRMDLDINAINKMSRDGLFR